MIDVVTPHDERKVATMTALTKVFRNSTHVMLEIGRNWRPIEHLRG